MENKAPAGLDILQAPRPAPSAEDTTAGSYFVSNYPPYSFWRPEHVPQALAALERAPAPGTPLGLYLHIPFCRKRCHFCYFKVYTDKPSSEIEKYLEALIREVEMYAGKPFVGGRKPGFVYFGGGTPSFLSSSQLTRLVESITKVLPWNEAEEVAFECEPGTVTEPKLRTIRDLGITRLSIGIENFDDAILKLNGRAHSSKEIGRIYGFARAIGFPQINIDLIAGMMGETPENWRENVRKTIELAPDSVTIYQMEVPYNTTIFHEMKASGQTVAPVESWKTKREWVNQAFAELEAAGYYVRSAYTAVKDPARTKFVYTDMLWAGADMIGAGVASFSHVGGTHFQNEHEFGPYIERVEQGALPIYRALTPTPEERMIREFVLQMKLGQVRISRFLEKYGVDLRSRFAEPLAELHNRGLMLIEEDAIRLNRDGLLQVDRLLHEFFLPQHCNARYA